MKMKMLAAIAFLPTVGLEAGVGEDLDRVPLPGEKSHPPAFSSLGGRLGMGTNRGTQLSTFEIYGTSRLWKAWQLNDTTALDLRFEGSMGLLWENNDESFLTRLGPLLDVTFAEWPLHFMLGTSVAFLADEKFGRLDLGSRYQFISSVGFDWDLTDQWVLGYRWQHISNAGLTDLNPGLNLNTVSVGFRF